MRFNLDSGVLAEAPLELPLKAPSNAVRARLVPAAFRRETETDSMLWSRLRQTDSAETIAWLLLSACAVSAVIACF